MPPKKAKRTSASIKAQRLRNLAKARAAKAANDAGRSAGKKAACHAKCDSPKVKRSSSKLTKWQKHVRAVARSGTKPEGMNLMTFAAQSYQK